MIKLMIIDDESEILKNLRRCIDWATWGIDLAGEATNAIDGREKALAVRPDILICDIHMPGKDGLTFCAELKMLLPKIKIIILSGHNEPGYLHRALSIGVSEYLLKPAGLDTIVPAVLNLKKQILEERAKDKEDYIRESLFIENLMTLRLQFINNLLSGSGQDPVKLLPRADMLGIPLEGPFYQTLIFRKYPEKADDCKSEIQLDMDYWHFTQALEEIQVKSPHTFFCEIETFDYFWLLNGADEETVLKNTDALIGALGTAFPDTYAIAVGTPTGSLAGIAASYAHARTALCKSAWNEDNNVFYYEGLMETGDTEYALAKLDRLIIDALITKQSALCIELITKAFSLGRQAYSPLAPLQAICRHILLVIAPTVGEENNAPAFSITEYHIESFHFSNDLEEWIVRQVQNFFQNRWPQACLPIVNKAVRYIHMNYPNGITLQKLAKELFITPNYLGKLFHQETGYKMSDYLNRFRIERAKEFLQDSKLSTNEVAEAVGFTSYKYFLVCFSKYSDCSLREFRSNI